MTEHFINKKGEKTGMLVLGALFILVSILFFIGYFNRQIKYGRTEGVVVDFIVENGYRHNEIAPKIKFIINSREYAKKAEGSFFANPFLKVGDRVKIFYFFSNTRNEVIIDSFMVNFGAGILSGIIGLLFISIGRSIKYE